MSYTIFIVHPNISMRLKVPLFQQTHNLDDVKCGPTALRMVLQYFGRKSSIPELCKLSGTRDIFGTRRSGLIKALKTLNLFTYDTYGASTADIKKYLEKSVPVIVNYRLHGEGHYGVMVGLEKGNFVLLDPYEPKPLLISPNDFANRWQGWHKTQFTHWLLAVSDKPLPRL